MRTVSITKRYRWTVGLALATMVLAGCAPAQSGPAATLPVMEAYEVGELVKFRIEDTIYLCEDELPYGIVHVMECERRPVMLQHSCIGIEGTGVDQYCEDGQVETVLVGSCSDAIFCEDTRIDDTFTWDQQEYVEITEECGGETIRREIEQQVPPGKYEVILRFWQDDQVVNRVLKEFVIASDGVDPVEKIGATVEEAVQGSLDPWRVAPYRVDQIEVLEEDGAAAKVRVVALFRTGADPHWTTMEATVECQKHEDGWECGEVPSFRSLLQPTSPQFEYPGDCGILDYAGSYLFKVMPVEGADGYRWVFVQDGVEVWDSFLEDGQPGDVTYGIHPDTEAHSRFAPGRVEVWVRASIDGRWGHAGTVTIHLR